MTSLTIFSQKFGEMVPQKLSPVITKVCTTETLKRLKTVVKTKHWLSITFWTLATSLQTPENWSSKQRKRELRALREELSLSCWIRESRLRLKDWGLCWSNCMTQLMLRWLDSKLLKRGRKEILILWRMLFILQMKKEWV